MLDITMFDDNKTTKIAGLDEANASLKERPQAALWVDMEDPTVEETREVAKAMKLHRLAVEALLRAGSSAPSYDFFDDHAVLGLATYNPRGAVTSDDLVGMRLVVGGRFIITYHRGAIHPVKLARQELVTRGTADGSRAQQMAYVLLDTVADGLLEATEKLEEQAVELETALLHRANRRILDRLVSMRRTAIKLRRLLVLQREALERLVRSQKTIVDAPNRVYFEDVLSRVSHAETLSDSVILVSESGLNSYLAAVNNRMNDVMKLLMVVGAVFLPLTFLTSLYGTNFTSLPGSKGEFSFWVLVGVMGVVAISLVAYFYRRGWLKREE